MSTTTMTAPTGAITRTRERAVPEPIPTRRIIGVELRKMFDTRSGFWLMMSIGILAVIATTATIIFAPEDELTYESFAAAIGFPMAVVLPMIAILSVTSEWSQRSALTTFTLVPSRGRVIAVKAFCAVAIGVVSMLVAGAVGALGNVVGTAIVGRGHHLERLRGRLRADHPGQRAGHDGGVHARRGVPQLRRRDRGLLRVDAGPAGHRRGAPQHVRSGSAPTSRGWTSTSRPGGCSRGPTG